MARCQREPARCRALGHPRRPDGPHGAPASRVSTTSPDLRGPSPRKARGTAASRDGSFVRRAEMAIVDEDRVRRGLRVERVATLPVDGASECIRHHGAASRGMCRCIQRCNSRHVPTGSRRTGSGNGNGRHRRPRSDGVRRESTRMGGATGGHPTESWRMTARESPMTNGDASCATLHGRSQQHSGRKHEPITEERRSRFEAKSGSQKACSPAGREGGAAAHAGEHYAHARSATLRCR